MALRPGCEDDDFSFVARREPKTDSAVLSTSEYTLDGPRVRGW
jgi:hypothetical protein